MNLCLNKSNGEYMDTILFQLTSMAIVVMLGWYMGKKKMLTEGWTAGSSNLLLRYIMPIVVITSMDRDYVPGEIYGLLYVTAFAVGALALMTAVAHFAFKKEEVEEKYASIVFNNGFMGIPLVAAVFGSEVIMFIAPQLAVMNIYCWTYGANLLSGGKIKTNWKTLLLNPNLLALIVGMVLYLTPLTLPSVLSTTLQSIGSLMTPVAMLVLGVYLSNQPLKTVFANKAGYKVSFVRMIVNPLLMVAIMYFIPGDATLKAAMILLHATPTAFNLAMFSQLTGRDTNYSSQIICLTTLLSVFTLPVIQAILLRVFF